ncbi:MAG: hypothetical protein RR009_08815 [Oscillospiraceae bacterium]
MEYFKINNIPAVLCGEMANKVCLFIHGKCGNKEEAERLAEIICPHGFQVLSIDLPEHGERMGESAKLVPWVSVPELQGVLSYVKKRWQSVSLHATSIGGYFSLLAFGDNVFEKTLLVSPVVILYHIDRFIRKCVRWYSSMQPSTMLIKPFRVPKNCSKRENSSLIFKRIQLISIACSLLRVTVTEIGK